MATTYLSTIEFRCWKEHTCVGCGGAFAYKFQRKVVGRGGTEETASSAAHQAVAVALAQWVDVQPCPSCGLYQPEMVALPRIPWHWSIFCLCVCAWLLVLLLAITGVVESDVAVWIATGVVALAGLAHLLTDLRNPNRRLDANRQLAQRRVEQGAMQVATPGTSEPSAEARAPRWSLRHRLAYAAFVLAAICVPAAELLRAAADWPYNAGWSPPVASPGDETEIYLPTQIECVKGYWRGEAEVVARDVRDAKFAPLELTATSSQVSWGEKISVKPSEKGSKRRPWVRVSLPQTPDLAGRTLKVKIRLQVTHPRSNGKGFDNVQQTLESTVELEVAPQHAGGRYSLAWWLGMLSGGAIAGLAGAYLISAAHAAKKNGSPTATYPIEEEPQE